MSGPPAPPAAKPGQAAYRAWWATAEGVPASPDVTYDQDAKAWDAAARAAIAAAPPFPLAMACTARDGDTVVIAFRERVTQRLAAEVHDRWASHAPGVKVAIVNNADEAASYRRDNDQLREQLAATQAIARMLQATAIEILDEFDRVLTHADATNLIDRSELARWRERLGGDHA